MNNFELIAQHKIEQLSKDFYQNEEQIKDVIRYTIAKSIELHLPLGSKWIDSVKNLFNIEIIYDYEDAYDGRGIKLTSILSGIIITITNKEDYNVRA